mgnify:CR=1 FL=1
MKAVHGRSLSSVFQFSVRAANGRFTPAHVIVPVEGHTWSLSSFGVPLPNEDHTWSLTSVGVHVSGEE